MISSLPEIEFISRDRSIDFPDEWNEISSDQHFWFEWRSKALFMQLKRLSIPIEDKLLALDTGCGSGILRRQMEEKTNWTVDGTDLNNDVLARNTSIRGRTLCYDVFEDPKPFVTSALKHLKAGGFLLMNLPSINFLFSDYDRAVGHYCRYGRNSLRAVFKDLPLNILDMCYWGLTLVPLMALRTLFSPLLRKQSDIVKTGFKPSGPITHSILRFLMNAETSIIKQPPLGTSLLLIGQKT